MENNKREAAKRPRQAKKASAKSVLTVFAVVFLLICGMVVGGCALNFFSTESRPAITYTFGEDKKVIYKLSSKKAYSANGELLVCFDDIAAMCEMAVTGPENARIFHADGTDEKISFKDGSPVATVNESEIYMIAEARESGGRIYVPLDFVERNVKGISVKKEKNSVTVTQVEYNASTDDEKLYFDVSFSGEDGPIAPPEDIEPVAPVYSFITDLSAYEEYMCPEDINDYLVLINKKETVDGSFVPSKLVDITNVRRDGRSEKMVETAEKALQALYIEMRAAGYTDVSVTSGYRTYAKQQSLYNTYVDREMKNNGISRTEAQAIVDTYSARPGTSEHQSGLACDMHNLSSASTKFAEEEAYTWLINNCYKFGFVLRFPKGKEDITGYSFEPWHYRFVGRYHASEMHRLGMCLEEYIEYLNEEK